MKTLKSFFRCISVILAVLCSQARASSSVKFGDELLRRGQFQLASLEYQRHLVDRADIAGAEATETIDKALQSMWLSRDYKASADLAEFYVGKYRDRNDLSCISEYYLGLSYYGLRAYPRSQVEFTQSLKLCSEPYLAKTQYWSGLGMLRLGDYEGARKSFSAIPAGSPKHGDALVALSASRIAEQLPRKSPTKAGLLNTFLPGSGYAYAGYPQTGAISFLTNGLFAWGTYAAAQKGQTALAVILGSINLAWYFGGIQGAANAATRTNEGRVNAVIKPLEIN